MYGADNTSFRGRKNVYECEACGARIITVDRDEGTTPYLTRCRAEGCGGWARSLLYRVPQDLRPTHEWYRPGPDDAVPPAAADHVRMGGLLLREIVDG